MRCITIILLFLGVNLSAQVQMDYIIGSNEISIIEFDTKLGAKLIKKRFQCGGIHKDIKTVTNDCRTYKRSLIDQATYFGIDRRVARKSYKGYCKDNFIIKLNYGDAEEYFKLLGLKIYCLPKKLIKEIETFEK